MTLEQAERTRLMRGLVAGPWRRMAQDRARGLGPQRADMWQAESYRLRVEALDRGMGDEVEGLESGEGEDVLGLDRIARDD